MKQLISVIALFAMLSCAAFAGTTGTEKSGKMKDCFENGVFITYQDIVADREVYSDSEDSKDTRVAAVGVQVQAQPKKSYDPASKKYGVQMYSSETTLPDGREGRIYLSSMNKSSQAEIPEPATYAYGLMGLASVFGLKRRIRK